MNKNKLLLVECERVAQSYPTEVMAEVVLQDPALLKLVLEKLFPSPTSVPGSSTSAPGSSTEASSSSTSAPDSSTGAPSSSTGASSSSTSLPNMTKGPLSADAMDDLIKFILASEIVKEFIYKNQNK